MVVEDGVAQELMGEAFLVMVILGGMDRTAVAAVVLVVPATPVQEVGALC